LETEKVSLEQSNRGKDGMIAGLNGQLVQAVAEINDQKRQVQTLQGDFRVAQRRLDDSEKIQQRLQNEGTNLMRSLDELREKVVDLTEDKVQLSDKLAHVTHALHDRDVTIATLETTLEEAKEETEKAQDGWRMKISKLEQEGTLAASSSSDRDKEFAELQKELEEALDSMRSLESERKSLQQQNQSRNQEIEYLTDTAQSQMSEMNRLQGELDEQKAAQVGF
jgi:myosin protein heavy chain